MKACPVHMSWGCFRKVRPFHTWSAFSLQENFFNQLWLHKCQNGAIDDSLF